MWGCEACDECLVRHCPCCLYCVDFARQNPSKLKRTKWGRKGRDGKGRANEPQKLQRGAAKFQRRKGIWGGGPTRRLHGWRVLGHLEGRGVARLFYRDEGFRIWAAAARGVYGEGWKFCLLRMTRLMSIITWHIFLRRLTPFSCPRPRSRPLGLQLASIRY